MNELPADPIGAAWLARTYGAMPWGRLPVLSQIGRRRATHVNDGYRLKSYAEAARLSRRLRGSFRKIRHPTAW